MCEEYGKLLLVLEPYLTWKQLLDIQLEIIQLEPKAKTLWSVACCAGEFYTHKTVTCLSMFDDRNAKLGSGTF